MNHCFTLLSFSNVFWRYEDIEIRLFLKNKEYMRNILIHISFTEVQVFKDSL